MKNKLSVLAAAALLGGGLTIATAAPALADTCNISLGGTCGAYADSTDFPPSNGFNTYVDDQSVGPNTGTTGTLSADGPTSWSAVQDAVPLGSTNVQTFPSIAQQFNDWNGSGWGGADATTPLTDLSALSVTYDITSPTDNSDNIYEFGSDLWTDYAGILGPGTGDIMMWPDTSSLRCTENGLSDVSILGHTTINSQVWTAYRYGPFGGEIVFILNGDGTTNYDPVTSGTCGQQLSGTLDQKAAVDWLIANGFIAGPQHVALLTEGWEVESADNATFTMNSTHYTATIGTGEDSAFSPYVTTAAPTGVTTSGATVNGTVLPENLSTSYQFDYGTTT